MKTKTVIVISLILSLMLIIILGGDRYIRSANSGILAFSLNVIPSLFPFMFMSKLVANLFSGAEFNPKRFKLYSKTFGVSQSTAYIPILSFLSGYPIGGKLIADGYANGEFDRQTAFRLATFCSSASPIFIVGTVAASMLHNSNLGLYILISHIFAILMTGFAFRKFKVKENDKMPFKAAHSFPQSKNILGDTISSSVMSIFIVGGYITVFFVLFDIIADLKLLYPLDFALSHFFEFIGLPKMTATALLAGMVEMTKGCVELSNLSISAPALATLACGILSFGGLGIAMQNLTFLKSFRFPTLLYFSVKLCHMFLSMGICRLLTSIFL